MRTRLSYVCTITSNSDRACRIALVASSDTSSTARSVLSTPFGRTAATQCRAARALDECGGKRNRSTTVMAARWFSTGHVRDPSGSGTRGGMTREHGSSADDDRTPIEELAEEVAETNPDPTTHREALEQELESRDRSGEGSRLGDHID